MSSIITRASTIVYNRVDTSLPRQSATASRNVQWTTASRLQRRQWSQAS